jgi:ParB family transcriptional regulator, chromosome partitioning protein
MNDRHRGLGRGLGALIPTAAQRAQVGRPTPAGAYFNEIPVGSVEPNPRQPRRAFDDDAHAELTASIGEVGVLQPIVVRPSADGRYELIMGERRLRACRAAGRELIPAIIRETADDELLRDALIENLHRAELNPLEEAAAYQQMLDDFEMTHDDLARRIGRSRPHITNTLRLLRLSPAVQRRVASGVLTAGHARALVAVDDPERQDRLAARVVAEGLSVRGLEEAVATDEPGSERVSTRRPAARPYAPGLSEIADRLAERLETRCRVQLGSRRGKISIEFASLDDLRRILAIIEGDSPSASLGSA